VAAIVRVWSRLKQLRLEQGFSSTPHVLLLVQEATDERADKRDMKADLLAELAETEALAAAEAEVAASAGEAAPGQFDRSSARAAITARLRRCRRPPGQPVVRPELHLTGVVTAPGACPPAERSRRARVAGTMLLVKVLINGREVTRTPAHALNDALEVTFDEMFSLQLSSLPRMVSLQLVDAAFTASFVHVGAHPAQRNERAAAGTLADCFLPLPGPTELAASVTPRISEFSCAELRYLGPKGPGGQECWQVAHGYISVKIGWGVGSNGVPLAPVTHHAGAPPPIQVTLPAPQESDPNDPRATTDPAVTSPLFPADRRFLAAADTAAAGGIFRLNSHAPSAIFHEATLLNPKRERLLLWRSQRIPEVWRRAIAACDSSLPPALLEIHSRLAANDLIPFVLFSFLIFALFPKPRFARNLLIIYTHPSSHPSTH
jgi:hypothetical protein